MLQRVRKSYHEGDKQKEPTSEREVVFKLSHEESNGASHELSQRCSSNKLIDFIFNLDFNMKFKYEVTYNYETFF